MKYQILFSGQIGKISICCQRVVNVNWCPVVKVPTTCTFVNVLRASEAGFLFSGYFWHTPQQNFKDRHISYNII